MKTDTPETDAKASDIIGFFSCATVPADFARRLERERDEAQKHLQDIKEYGTEEINVAVELRQKLAAALLERDEARDALENYKASTVHSCNEECKRPMCVLRRERDEARARVELIKPHKNNPVAEYFSSNTPETDAAVISSNGQWSFVLKETCQRLERERNKAVEDATNYFARIGELEKERDEAMEALSGRTVSCAACNHAAIERDEAKKHLRDILEYGTEEINAAVELRQKLAAALLERDKAREDLKITQNAWVKAKAERAAALHERDEARSLVDHYREQKDLLPISWDV